MPVWGDFFGILGKLGIGEGWRLGVFRPTSLIITETKKKKMTTFRVNNVCKITTCPEIITTLVAPYLDVKSLAVFGNCTAHFHNKFRSEVASRKASEFCQHCKSVCGFKIVASLPDEKGWRARFDEEGPDEPIECSIYDHSVCVKCGACQGYGCWSCCEYGENYTIPDETAL